MNELKLLRMDMNSILRLTKCSKLPSGLKLLLMDTFKCSICQSIITAPVSYSRCCQSIIGCQSCVDSWYSGNEGRTKGCPLCMRERAIGEMSRLNGLNDFLEKIRVFDDDLTDNADGAGPSEITIPNQVPTPPRTGLLNVDEYDVEPEQYDFP